MATLGLPDPLVWVNDASYARFALSTGWPTVYDVTDDWLLAPLRALAGRPACGRTTSCSLEGSDAVVVCSPGPGPFPWRPPGRRPDPERSRRRPFPHAARPGPPTLPPARSPSTSATLHEERIDVPLLVELAEAATDAADRAGRSRHLGPAAERRLAAVPTIHLLGARPYGRIPAFLQHADIVVVPHLVNPFTESLDPIKAYECLAAGRPTVATPVAGFRGPWTSGRGGRPVPVRRHHLGRPRRGPAPRRPRRPSVDVPHGVSGPSHARGHAAGPLGPIVMTAVAPGSRTVDRTWSPALVSWEFAPTRRK